MRKEITSEIHNGWMWEQQRPCGWLCHRVFGSDEQGPYTGRVTWYVNGICVNMEFVPDA